MNTPISVLLTEKSNEVFSVPITATVQQAVLEMNRYSIGSVVVLDQGKLAGIFTERDVLQRIVAEGRNPNTTLVRQVMSSKLTTIKPSISVPEALKLITNSRHRHLPVVKDGELLGLISNGDLTRFLSANYAEEAGSLWNYITGDNPYSVIGH